MNCLRQRGHAPVAVGFVGLAVGLGRLEVPVGGWPFAGTSMLAALWRHVGSLRVPGSWPATIGLAVAWLVLMLAYSPWADRIATRWVDQKPALHAFRALQQSRSRLLAGLLVAWALGGFLEELVLRGIILPLVAALMSLWLVRPIAVGIAVGAAAALAGFVHLYQGPRAALIITQLSVLFGVLYVISGYNLWAVIVCHGLYDTIAFIRFATKRSKYSNLSGDALSGSAGDPHGPVA